MMEQFLYEDATAAIVGSSSHCGIIVALSSERCKKKKPSCSVGYTRMLGEVVDGL